MNCLTFLLVNLLSIRTEDDFCKVQSVYFLESQSWYADHIQLKTDKRYLSKLGLGVEFGDGDYCEYDYFLESCYSLKSTNLEYLVLPKLIIKAMDNVFYSPNNYDGEVCLKFNFSFTDKLIKNSDDFKNYKGNVQKRLTYKLVEHMTDDILITKTEGTGIRMEFIKNKFSELISMKPLNLKRYIRNIGSSELLSKLLKPGNDLNFKLLYFENYCECHDNFKEFVEDLRYFTLLDDHVFNISSDEFKKSLDKTTTITVSRFKERLQRKFFRDLKKSYDIDFDETWKELFNRSFYYISEDFLNNNVFFPINNEYDTSYYISQLSKLIYESVKDKKGEYATVDAQSKNIIFDEMKNLLFNSFEKLQKLVIKDLCKSEYVTKHFSELLSSKIETLDDFIEFENIMCDYYNIFTYISDLYHGFFEKDKRPYSSVTPIFIDDYNMKIIDGIQIEYNSSAKFGHIKAFDCTENEITIVENVDFFIDKNILYFPSEVLKMKNIYEIEVISSDGKNSMMFKVNNYLNI